MKINKYDTPRDNGTGRGDSNGSTVIVQQTGGGSSSGGYADEAGHAENADYATVAGNLDENSTDWTTMALRFLSKTVADTAAGLITFLAGLRAKVVSYFEKGVEFGEYQTGALGTGGAVLIDQDGNSVAEFDYLTVRKAASFREISIKELKHVGGEIVLSAAAMKCARVVPLTDSSMNITGYKCFFDTTDSSGAQVVFQEFVVGDLARCQKFGASNGEYVSTKYYWRKVIAVGEDYIILSNADGEKDTGSVAPTAGDNIVQLGYTGNDNPYRKSAIILSATDTDAPSMKFYQNITSFSLPSPVKDEGYDVTTGVFHSNTYGDFFVGDQNGHVSYNSQTQELDITGRVQMNSSSTFNGNSLSNIFSGLGAAASQAAQDAASALAAANAAQDAADDAQDAADAAQSTANGAQQAVDNMSTGVENLVVNGGFTGLYSSESVEDLTDVDANTQVFSEPFGRWTTHTGCTVVSAVASATGVACKMQSGRLVQTISRGIKSGEKYTFSLRGIAAGTVTVSIGGVSQTLTVAAGTRSSVKFTTTSTSAALTITGSATITEILLVQGSITINDWVPSPEDNNKYLAYYKNLAYLLEAIGNASTTTLGGLILTQMIRVGNYANQVMTQETGGMSGSNVSSDSPFLWGGGTMQQAISTIAAYANDPTFQPTAAQLANMAKFVVTHGGRAILQDIIMRGIVYASGGKFTGEDGLYKIEVDADDRHFSIFGPNWVESATDLTPKAGATAVEYMRIGDFTATVGGGSSGYRVEPVFKMQDGSGTGKLSLNTYNGLVFDQIINNVTKSTIFGPASLWSDASYFTLVLKGLPLGDSSMEVGQIYRDNSGYLRIRTS